MRIKIVCQTPECGAVYEFDAAKIPPLGGRMTCRNCAAKLIIRPRAELETAAAQNAAPLPAPVLQTGKPPQEQTKVTGRKKPRPPVQRKADVPYPAPPPESTSNGKSTSPSKPSPTVAVFKSVLEELRAEIRALHAFMEENDVAAQLQALNEAVADLRKQVDSLTAAKRADAPFATGAFSEEDSTAHAPAWEIDEENVAVFRDWFDSIGYTLREVKVPKEVDDIYDRLAIELGEKYEVLAGIYEVIKRYVNSGQYFNYSLKDNSPEEISLIVNYCCKLTKYAFLRSKFKSQNPYHRRSRTISAAPQRIGKVVNFFTGGWLERFVYRQICRLLTIVKLPYHAVTNAQINNGNGDINELDMVFLVNEQPLWIECKTNNYQDFIIKYTDLRQRMNIPKDQAVLVVLGISDTLSAELTNLYELTVLSEKNYIDHVARTLRKMAGENLVEDPGDADDIDSDE